MTTFWWASTKQLPLSCWVELSWVAAELSKLATKRVIGNYKDDPVVNVYLWVLKPYSEPIINFADLKQNNHFK